MVSKKSPVCGQILSVCFVIFLAAFAASAQIDPNPDSPTPVLISQKDSLRVLATSVDQTEGEILTPTDRQAFMPNSRIVIYITNVDLLADEDAGAFRLYVEDSKGRKYRFPVLDARPVKGQQGVYALTVMLRDEIGFLGTAESERRFASRRNVARFGEQSPAFGFRQNRRRH